MCIIYDNKDDWWLKHKHEDQPVDSVLIPIKDTFIAQMIIQEQRKTIALIYDLCSG